MNAEQVKPALFCPKCNAKGGVFSNKNQILFMECKNKHKWKTTSETCPKCFKPNGYAVEGICGKCYSEQLSLKMKG